MAVDMFLQIDGIPGESKDPTHKDQIELLSFHFGCGVQPSGSAGGSAGGKVSFSDMVVTHHVDVASPKLMQACAKGQHATSAVIFVRDTDRFPQEYLQYTMTQVFITSVQTGGAGGEIPIESVSLSYDKIVVDYKPQKGGGT